jgi:hypothetical protein
VNGKKGSKAEQKRETDGKAREKQTGTNGSSFLLVFFSLSQLVSF